MNKLIIQLEADEFSKTKVIEVAEDFHKAFPKTREIKVNIHISYKMEANDDK